MKNYVLIKDLPAHRLKKGTLFEWDSSECCYITRELPYFLTPLVSKSDIKNKTYFKPTKEANYGY